MAIAALPVYSIMHGHLFDYNVFNHTNQCNKMEVLFLEVLSLLLPKTAWKKKNYTLVQSLFP